MKTLITLDYFADEQFYTFTIILKKGPFRLQNRLFRETMERRGHFRDTEFLKNIQCGKTQHSQTIIKPDAH